MKKALAYFFFGIVSNSLLQAQTKEVYEAPVLSVHERLMDITASNSGRGIYPGRRHLAVGRAQRP